MAEQQRAKERRAEFLLLMVVLIWAANYPVAKYGLKELSPLLFNGIRYAIAAGVVAVMFFSRSTWTPIASADWLLLLRAGFIANVVYQLAFIIGLSMTSAGNAAILLSTSPLWTLFLSARMHKEHIHLQMWTGMVISLLGVAMIIFGSGKKLELGSVDVYGDLITLAAGALWGLNTNLQKPLLSRLPAVQVTFVMISVGAVGLGIAAIPAALTTPWLSLHWTFYLAAIVSGAFAIAVANFFWSTGVKYLGPGRTANYTNLVPVLAFVISYFALDEKVFLIHFIGAAVTVFGVWYARH
ncbi:MAG: DMT family transporter [Bacteroidota bacterium]